jgi:hypothetical protein
MQFCIWHHGTAALELELCLPLSRCKLAFQLVVWESLVHVVAVAAATGAGTTTVLFNQIIRRKKWWPSCREVKQFNASRWWHALDSLIRGLHQLHAKTATTAAVAAAAFGRQGVHSVEKVMLLQPAQVPESLGSLRHPCWHNC